MAGYDARQETYTTGDTIEASDTNNEFDAIVSAFGSTGGHSHDGSAGEGTPVTVTDLIGGTANSLAVLNGSGNSVTATSALSAGQLVIGSTGVPAAKTVSGDLTLNSSGVASLSTSFSSNINFTGTLGFSGATLTFGSSQISGASVVTATTAVEGVSQLATNAETVTGTGTDRVNTPAGLTARFANPGAFGGGTPGAGNFTTLGATDVTFTGGSISGITDLAVADGGTGSSNPGDARSALGLAFGSDVQAWDADLDSISGLSSTTDGNIIVGSTGGWTMENGATARTSLGLAIGSDVQAWDADLDTFASLNSTTAGNVAIVGSTGDWTVENGATLRASLGLAIGSDVEAVDAEIVRADTDDVLAAGYQATADADGTQSSGTYTPAYAGGNFKTATNGGAHTLAPQSGDGQIIVQYTNDGSAGAITTSGFDAVTGDSFTTTNGDDFMCYLTVVGTFQHLHITALQ